MLKLLEDAYTLELDFEEQNNNALYNILPRAIWT